MKKIMSVLVFVSFLSGIGSSAYAALTPVAINATADVAAATSFTAVVHDTNLAGTARGQSLDFGTLIANASGNLVSPTTKDIVLSVNTQGLAFDISATGTDLAIPSGANAGVKIPSGAYVVTNAYIAADNSNVALPTGAVVSQTSGGPVVGTNRAVYHSQDATVANPVALTVIEAFPGISDDTSKGVPAGVAVLASQVAGHYTGTITYTVTTR